MAQESFQMNIEIYYDTETHTEQEVANQIFSILQGKDNNIMMSGRQPRKVIMKYVQLEDIPNLPSCE